MQAVDVVSPATGRLSVESVDAGLVTPLGEIPVSRIYRQDASGEPGWSIDIALRLELAGERRLLVLRGAQPVAALESRDGANFAGDGLSARRADGAWEMRTRADSRSRFDAAGREVARTDASGNRIDFAYDAAGRVARAAAVAGRGLSFAYDAAGRLEAIRDPAGRASVYRYDAAGRLVTVVAFDGIATHYGHDGQGRLNAIAEAGGERIGFAYDERGRIAERTSSRAGKLTFAYGAATRVSRADGYWWEIASDSDGLPLRRLDSLGNREAWAWDGDRRLASRTFADGSTTTYAYDAAGRVVRQSTSGGATLAIAYDGASERPSTVDHAGAVTRFEYDAQGRVTRHVSAAGRATRFSHDAQGRRIATTDAAGHATRFAFDAAGNVLSRTDPDGGTTSWTYDAAGRVERMRDALGATWSYRYTPQGWLASIAGPAGTQISYTHDADGRVVAERAGSQTVRYGYDDAGRVATIDAGAGSALTLAYDAGGNLARVTDATGRTTATEFDALGRPVRTTLPTGVVISRHYGAGSTPASIDVGKSRWSFSGDPAARTTRVTDSAGGAVTITRDVFGRPTSLDGPGGGRQRWQYDADGLVEAVTTATHDTWRFARGENGTLGEIAFPGGGVERFERDAAGRIAGLVYAWGGRVQARHDAAGRRVERRGADGRSVEYAYDAEGRIVRAKSADAQWSYRYDGDGRLVEAAGRDHSVRYAYDDAGRVVRVDYPQWRASIVYAYDAAGRLASRTGPDGSVARFAYDAFGRTSGIESREGRHTIAWDDVGRMTRVTAPNGTSTQLEFDVAGRVSSVVHVDASGKPFSARRYRHDAGGNRIEIADETGRVATYRYDLAGQLIAEIVDGVARDYALGPAGDRTAVRSAAATIDYRYDAGGRLVQAGDAVFEWNADGQLIARRDAQGATRYAYDAEGRLTRVDLPSGKRVQYGYGPFGERIWREEDGKRSYFVHDGDDVLAELGDGFEVRRTWLYAGTDHPLAVVARDGVAAYLHADDLGSVLAVTDAGGKVAGRYAFDAFGNVASEGAAAALPPPRYAGRPLDAAAGLYDMRARQYDPRVGRFISPDPALGAPEDPASLLPYAYARNNPLRFVDRFGAAATLPDYGLNRMVFEPGVGIDAYDRFMRPTVRGPYPWPIIDPAHPRNAGRITSLEQDAAGRPLVVNEQRVMAARAAQAAREAQQAQQAAAVTGRSPAPPGQAAAAPMRQTGAGSPTVMVARPPNGNSTWLGRTPADFSRAMGRANAAMAYGDLAGEVIAATWSGDDAWQSVLAAGGARVMQGLAGGAVVGYAGSAVAGAASTLVPAAWVGGAGAVAAGAGAVVGGAVVVAGAVERSYAAYTEIRGYLAADAEESRRSREADAAGADVTARQDEIVAGLASKLDQVDRIVAELETLRVRGEARSVVVADLKERIATQVAQSRLAGRQAQGGGADADGTLGAAIQRYRDAAAEARRKLQEAQDAAQQACAIQGVATPTSDQLAKARSAAERAAKAAAEAKTKLPLPLDFGLTRAVARTRQAEIDAIRTNVDALDARMAEGRASAKTYDAKRKEAEAIRADVVARARRLMVAFPALKRIAEIYNRAHYYRMPPENAVGELVAGDEVSAKFAHELADPVVGTTTAAAASPADELAKLDEAFDQIRKDADAAAQKAADCVKGAAQPASPAGDRVGTCTTDSDCPLGEICGPQKTCIPAPAVQPTGPQRQDDADAPSPGGDATRRRPAVCNYINIAPRPSEVRPNETVTFIATAVFTDGSTRDVTAIVQWQPGPRNQYSAPGDLRFNQRVVVRASLGECTGSIEFNVLAPSWSPPLSHADDLGARGQEPGPADYTWYALCKKGTGDIVYGESTDPTRYFIMGGPFPGPRNARFWIEQNCPRWRCTDAGACAVDPARSSGPGWYVVCDKNDLHVYATENYVATRHWILQERLYGAPEADLWIQRNCPGRLCTQNGACAAGQLRTGGRWAVVCSKSHGGVALTEYPNRVDHWVWVENLYSEIDARAWTNQNCPSWRCDRDGKCLPGSAPSVDDALRLFGERDATRQAERGGTGTFGVPGSGGFTTSDMQDAMQSGQPLPGHGHADGGPEAPGTPTGGTTTPQPGTTKPPSVPEQKQWYGIETKVVYDWQGRRCTLTDAFEGQSTPSGLASLTNEAQGKALGPVRGAGGRTVLSVTSRVYAGPAASKPGYPGKTGVVCENPAGSGTGTTTPSVEKRQDYLFEAVVAYEKNDIVTGVGPRIVACTLTGFMVFTIGASEVQASLRDWGQKMLGVVRGNDKALNGRLVSTRVVSGPSAHIPYPNPQHRIACKP